MKNNGARNIDRNSIPVMESFYTIQGEGYHQGKAAYFIRLGGCDVGCVWCDVKESWDKDAHPVLKLTKLLRKLKVNLTAGIRRCNRRYYRWRTIIA